MTNRNDENWKAYADSVSSANLSKALNRGPPKTSPAVSQKEPIPEAQNKQKESAKNSNRDVVKPK